MSNIEKYPKCRMRTSLGNCDPIGGFCTSVKTVICEALHKVAEPKTGEWIIHDEVKNIYGGVYIECSECGTTFVTQTLEDERFCRNCGARMYKGGAE